MSAPITPYLGYPLFDGVDEGGRLPWQEGNKSIRESMINILLTRPGERLLRPEFGAGLRGFLHHPNNETTRSLMRDSAQRALSRWEPRAIVEEVHVVTDETRLSHVNMSIRYRLLQDGSRDGLELSLQLGT
jgi:uncharacterized protein